MSAIQRECRAASASILRMKCSQLPWPPCSSTSGGPSPKRCQHRRRPGANSGKCFLPRASISAMRCSGVGPSGEVCCVFTVAKWVERRWEHIQVKHQLSAGKGLEFHNDETCSQYFETSCLGG